MATNTGSSGYWPEVTGAAIANYSAILQIHKDLTTSGNGRRDPKSVKSIADGLSLMLTTFQEGGLSAVISDTHPDSPARLAEIQADVERVLSTAKGNGDYGNRFMLTLPGTNNGGYKPVGVDWGTIDGIFE